MLHYMLGVQIFLVRTLAALHGTEIHGRRGLLLHNFFSRRSNHLLYNIVSICHVIEELGLVLVRIAAVGVRGVKTAGSATVGKAGRNLPEEL